MNPPAGRPFPTTRWTLILDLKGTEPRRVQALEELCGRYWLPIYGYVRHRFRSPEEAQDLTQAFFHHFLNKNGFEGVDGDKGKLRSYLLRAADWFLTGEWRKADTVKRGGHAALLSIDHDVAEERLASAPSGDLDPEKAYDQRWARAVLAGVDEALRAEYEARGRSAHHDLLRKYLFWNSGGPTYAEVAVELGITESNTRQMVRRMRARYGEILREHVAFTVDVEADIDEEIRSLFAAFTAE